MLNYLIIIMIRNLKLFYYTMGLNYPIIIYAEGVLTLLSAYYPQILLISFIS